MPVETKYRTSFTHLSSFIGITVLEMQRMALLVRSHYEVGLIIHGGPDSWSVIAEREEKWHDRDSVMIFNYMRGMADALRSLR